MTDSADTKPTPRHNRLNSQAEDFDFDLVDVRVTPDQEDPAPIALDDFVADELLVDANESQQQSSEPNSFIVNKPSTLIAPAQVVPEIKTNFYVDYFDKRKQPKTPKSEPVAVANTNQTSTIDNRSQDAMTAENNAEIPAEPFYSEDDEQPLDSQAPVVNGAGMAVAVLSQFKSKQESINKQQEKLIQEFSQKIKTATAVTYTAVFFGVIALAAATTLGVMLLKTKSEVSDLAGTTTAIKDDIRNIAKATPEDLEGTDPSIDQLNQKVDDVIEQLNEVTALQNKISTSEKTAITSKPAMNVTPAPVEKAVTAKSVTNVIPAPVEKTVVTAKPATTKPQGNTQPPATVAEKKPTPENTAKATPAKAVKNTPAEQVAPVVKATTAKPENNAKSTNKTGVYAPKKLSDIPDKAMQVPANDINKVVNAATPNTASSQATTTAPQTTNTKPQTGTGGWTVNLGSSNKLEDAKNTAARFAQKGIPVSISSVTVKNETRYRLQVKGFKTKDEAAAYANKAKDTLKLNSVWINP